jgi:outer membrane lipoprotein SlyB
MRMQSRNNLLPVASAALVAACLWLPSTPVFAQKAATATSQTSDSALRQQVQSEIQNDSQLSGQQIQVSVQGGQVTLSGSVQNTQQWQQAENVAAGVNGVRTIQNNLTIAGQPADSVTPPPPPASQAQSQTSDQGQTLDQQGQNAQSKPNQTATASGQQNGNPPPPPPDVPPQARAPYQGQSYSGGYGQSSRNQYAEPGYEQGPPPAAPSGPVSVPAGTLLQIRTDEPLDTAHLSEGEVFQATVASDLYEGNVLAIPRGAMLQGSVVRARDAGPFGGSPTLELKLTQLDLGGNTYPVQTDIWSNRGPNNAGYTAGNAVGGAAVGAILGSLIGRGAGALVGAGVGAAAGFGASAATNGRLMLAPETLLNFHLASPVTVQPVSWQEAQRLSSSTPVLQQRPQYYPPPPPPYYYAPYRVYYGW